MKGPVLVISTLALLERAATFASGPLLTCEALDKIVAVDGNDKGPDLQQKEILASARALRGAGCGKYVASDDILERRFETGDHDGDGDLDPLETKAMIDALADAPKELLLKCVAGLYEAVGCSSSRRKLLIANNIVIVINNVDVVAANLDVAFRRELEAKKEIESKQAQNSFK